MKIVHFIDYFNYQLGYQEPLLAKYHAKKHEVFVVTSDRYFPFPNYEASYEKLLGPRQQKAGEEKIDGYLIKRLKAFFEIPSSTIILFKGIYRTFKKIQPDIIICHSLIRPNIFWVCMYKKFNPKCKIVADHHDAVYNTNLTDSLAKRVYLRLWKIIIKPLILKYVDKLIATGPNEKEFAIEFLFGEKYRNNIEILSLAADEEIFYKDVKKRESLRKKYNFKDNDLVIFNAGKLNQTKKIYELLTVFTNLKQKNKNVYLFIIGKGNPQYIEKIVNYIKSHELEKSVFLKDFIPNEELAGYLNMADIGCWPGSRSNIFWEAMACGLPLILEDEVYTKELVENSNGYTSDNNADLESHLKELIEDKELRNKMSTNSEKLFQKKFSYTKLAEEFIK